MLSQRFDSTVAMKRNIVWFLHRRNQVPQATMKENPGFAQQLGTHSCDSRVQIDAAMQFGDARHVDTEDDIQFDFTTTGNTTTGTRDALSATIALRGSRWCLPLKAVMTTTTDDDCNEYASMPGLLRQPSLVTVRAH